MQSDDADDDRFWPPFLSGDWELLVGFEGVRGRRGRQAQEPQSLKTPSQQSKYA